jgi:antitoxin (DNA-binding transcriptional repressor) of toxin-antitoxin stability system
MYIVHMKRVNASEVRRNWFQILDEVARGEKVVIERRGRRIVVVCEDLEEVNSKKKAPDYNALLQVTDADQADEWSWNWSEDGLELQTDKLS